MPRAHLPASPLRYFNSSPEVIRLVVMMYVRFPLSLPNVKAAALTSMKKALKRHGSPEAIITDSLCSYRTAMNELGNADKQEVGRWANNRVENSHLSFRRREPAMLRFNRMKAPQKFANVHANIHNHFNLERHLVDRETYKAHRSAPFTPYGLCKTGD